jgi:hypothetical protein
MEFRRICSSHPPHVSPRSGRDLLLRQSGLWQRILSNPAGRDQEFVAIIDDAKRQRVRRRAA